MYHARFHQSFDFAAVTHAVNLLTTVVKPALNIQLSRWPGPATIRSAYGGYQSPLVGHATLSGSRNRLSPRFINKAYTAQRYKVVR
jgi:hypothetical protein